MIRVELKLTLQDCRVARILNIIILVTHAVRGIIKGVEDTLLSRIHVSCVWFKGFEVQEVSGSTVSRCAPLITSQRAQVAC